MFSKLIAALLSLVPLVVPADQADCSTDRIDEQVKVAHVHDGDTVRLADGRKLRIIGIDTPELATRKRAAEPLATAARNQLHSMLAKSKNRLLLRFDVERRDPYQRLLAHAFFSDGKNVAEHLLRRGLATSLVLPPNVWQAECYKTVESYARNQRTNLWHLPSHQSVTVDELAESGFKIVRGRVKKTRVSTNAVYIYLQRNTDTSGPILRAKIAKEDLHYFPEDLLQNIRGSSIEVRGIVHRPKKSSQKDKQFYLRLHHPVAMQILTPQAISD